MKESRLSPTPRLVKGETSPPAAAAAQAGDVFEFRDIAVVEIQIEPSSRIALYSDPRSPGADRFRFLRMRLREMAKSRRLQRLLITSPLPGDGKSTIALNLTTALSEHGKYKVLLIEGDFYRPALVSRLGIPAGPGFAACLEDNLHPLRAVRRIEPLHWYLLPAGQSRHTPTELLQSDELPGVLQKLSPYFDWIVIDTPPVLPLADTASLVQHTDASLLVVRADHTPKERIEEALSLLGPQHALGIILNAAEGLNRVYSSYYGYYGSK
jgi:protein-tyrosine kinase